jgi:ABC-type branched-subunit amino acid transport system substrate-binding protein
MPASDRRHWRRPRSSVVGRPSPAIILLAALTLAACLPISRPTVTIGLVAPFEGRYRDVGYEVIYAVRLAVREANAAGGIAGYNVALLALDDGGDPVAAVEQARKLAAAPEVIGVVGHWIEAPTLAAAPAYAEAGLPLLATAAGDLPAETFRLWLTPRAQREAVPAGARQCPPPCDSLEDLHWLLDTRARHPGSAVFGPALWGQPQFLALAGDAAEGAAFISPAPYPADSADPGFAARYRAVSGGVEPRANAILAYDAARLLFAAIERGVKDNGQPNRANVAVALAEISLDGLSGPIEFDAAGNWAGARAWAYAWRAGQVVRR